METKFGFPLVNADNAFEVFSELGIKRWKRIGKPIPLEEYLSRELNPEEKADLRFVPKLEAVFFKKPDGGTFRGFRFIGGGGFSGTVIFTLLPGNLVVICAEFRHGYEDVVINLPGGQLDGLDPITCIKKEFKEETGIVLKKVIPLSEKGTTMSARISTCQGFNFLGLADSPPVMGNNSLDEDEFLKTALVPLADWIEMIEKGSVIENWSIATTFLALRYLERNRQFHV